MNEDKFFDGYIERMGRSLEDKLFFTKFVKADIYLDYGCATGDLLNGILKSQPNVELLGYDLSPKMVDEGRKKYKHIWFSNNYNNLVEYCSLQQSKGKRVALIFSSVLHEVFTDIDPLIDSEECEEFFLANIGWRPDYVIIRDMGMSPGEKVSFPDQNHPSCVAKVRKYFVDRLAMDRLQEFTKMYGSIFMAGNFVHLLLKYDYVDRWKEELCENYILDLNMLNANLSKLKYETIHYWRYTPEFIHNKIKKDFDIDLQYSTHLRGIWKNRG